MVHFIHKIVAHWQVRVPFLLKWLDVALQSRQDPNRISYFLKFVLELDLSDFLFQVVNVYLSGWHG